MTSPLDFVLFLIAAVLFAIAFVVALFAKDGRSALIPGGLFAATLAFLIAAWPGH
jgi:hypothetical protein